MTYLLVGQQPGTDVPFVTREKTVAEASQLACSLREGGWLTAIYSVSREMADRDIGTIRSLLMSNDPKAVAALRDMGIKPLAD